MKKATIILIILVLAFSVFAGCRNEVKPTPSPNVPIASETPAIPSPDLDGSPEPDETLEPVESLNPVESMEPVESVEPTANP